MTQPITIYLADDHQIVIDGLKLLIVDEASYKVVGTAVDGETAKNEILTKRPDIALIDFRMPKLSGLEIIAMVKRELPDTHFVILSMHDNQSYMKDALAYKASGYLLKNAGKSELMKCLSIVLNGDTYFPNIQTRRQDVDKSLFTPREMEVVRLILDEFTTAQIALELGLSTHTVDVHRKNIARKTNTKTNLGLSKFLLEHKIEI